MDLDKYNDSFSDYVDEISITKSQADRIESALQSIITVMLSAYPDAEIYAQGSYAYDALTKPLTAKQSGGSPGEFDIDIAVQRTDWAGAADSLDEINDLLEENGTYSRMQIDNTKSSCVRIDYAEDESGVGFHVDIVPTRLKNDERRVADRKKNEWKKSDAKRFADWFNDHVSDKPNVRPLIIMLKRLRDLHGQSDNLKSITIVSLVVERYTSLGSLPKDFVDVLGSIADDFNDESKIKIPNPVNTGEDLADHIEDYASVAAFLKDIYEQIEQALVDEDADALSELFGPGFSYSGTKSNTAAAALSSLSAQPVRAYGSSSAHFND